MPDAAAAYQADAFTSVPAYPACDGIPGEGAWRDCGMSAGVGVNN